MKFQAVKGTRDFYPSDMAVRNWTLDGWKKVSVRNGFEEYDGPIFEYLKMFQVKSGDEIVEQLFSLTDRAGRKLALRPEITPTLARMVNQKISSLPKPIKWFSVPRLFRAERPQKGRLREFFQWNVDIIGVDDVLADAEVIFTAVDYLQDVGLTADDVVVKISSRKMLSNILKSIGITEKNLEPLYSLLDKKNKLPQENFEKLLNQQIKDSTKRDKVLELMNADSLNQIGQNPAFTDTTGDAVSELAQLFEILDTMGVKDFCTFDIGIVRGLAYYTGIVFEIYDKDSQLRAIGGGGRYDNLLKNFGGPDIPATGFGIGDCVLAILLKEKGLLRKETLDNKLDYFIAFADDKYKRLAIDFTSKIRRAGKSADFSYKGGKLGKQLKEASSRKAKNCIIIGSEIENEQLVVKDMDTGEQEIIDKDKFFKQLEK